MTEYLATDNGGYLFKNCPHALTAVWLHEADMAFDWAGRPGNEVFWAVLNTGHCVL